MFGNTFFGTNFTFAKVNFILLFAFAKVPHCEKKRNKSSKSCGINQQKVAEYFYKYFIYNRLNTTTNLHVCLIENLPHSVDMLAYGCIVHCAIIQ